ncbi:ABC transporter ATP-binding protein [Intrasporangium chromatireducens Q5-1]|uniref:ABC transporter ATP-binding protein n=1 Tax=Intrasporangium chromatireducens Q5-1 TaxID=584657 RepID=W9GRC0_9MICO|nr:ATP-binding cassette domain-containing protein [Intrasporangium chromatireducens]EWT07582.1 ABC transporter ATP-binding protein [Intrasporangium chromatireducens Q5-1]
MPARPPLIRLSGVSKQFGSVRALEDISLEIPAGEIHGIVGPSGAGKSTLIRCLTGLEPPTSGEVQIAGTRIDGLRGAALRRARRSIGMVFQDVHLLSSRTAAGNVSHPLEVAGAGRAEREGRVAELLELVGLADRADSYPAQLSGGQQQRVGIARALATRPPVLLCDEPTSALDAETTRQILDLLRRLRDRLGITVVVITHEPSVVREACDSVTLLDRGRVAQSGGLLDVVTSGDTPLARALVPLPPSDPDRAGRLVAVSLGGSAQVRSARDVLAVLDAAGIPAEIAAATLETIDGHRVGRLQLEVADSDAAERVTDLLSGQGLAAEVAA